MDTNLKKKAEDLVESLRIIKQATKNIPSAVRLFVAFGVGSNQENIKNINDIKDYIKSHSPWYSYFRGRKNIYLLCGLLADESIYKMLFNSMFNYYQILKPATTFGSPFLLYASFIIAKSNEAPDKMIKKTMNFYQEFKKAHRYLTTSYDFVNASILAGFNDIQNMNEIEKCYTHLRARGFSQSGSTLSLAQLLMLSRGEFPSTTNWRELAGEISSFNQQLRINRVKTDFYSLPLLALVPLMEVNSKVLASDIKEVAACLATYKDCFGLWQCSRSNRVLIATGLVFDYYLEHSSRINPMFTNKFILKVILASIITRIVQDEAAMAAGSD